ncbi:type VI secretion system contractile sheath small subunit [Luteibacter sp.]|jgi:type VI secretion system protein ImpB|uniref:type VI secretion system contractile sheath small subunit n=1 Tax=Luteibacter sp. TaxID=1886636 RepID=UPI002F429994
MSDSFQREIPKARVNISLDLHTGGAKKRVEIPLKLLVMGDYSGRDDDTPLASREKHSIDRNNFDAVLSDLAPAVRVDTVNTLAGGDATLSAELRFASMKDFEPDAVARQVPELRVLLAMRNLLRDLRSNLLDNAAFRRELERVLRDEALSASLRNELDAIADDVGRPA